MTMIESKFAIAIYEDDKTYYITKLLFNITNNDWFTKYISDIPENWLFDTYTEALNGLCELYNFHNLLKNYNIKIKQINVLKPSWSLNKEDLQ